MPVVNPALAEAISMEGPTLVPHMEKPIVMPLQGTLGEKKAAAFFAFQTGPYTDAYKNQKVGNKNAPI